MSHHLSGEQLRQFKNEGLLVVEDVLSSTETDAVLKDYEHRLDEVAALYQDRGLIDDPMVTSSFAERYTALAGKVPGFFEHLDITLPLVLEMPEDAPYYASPAVFDIITNEKILDIAESILGPEISSNPAQHVRIKPPEIALTDQINASSYIGRTTWHPDMGALLDEAIDSNILTVWVAITDAQVENGCLLAIPESHKTADPHFAMHCPGASINAENYIPGRELAPGERRALPVRKGSLVLFNPYTQHCALPNKSDQLRFSLDLRYNVAGQASGRPAFPSFVARSRSAPETELRNAREWDKLWSDARESLVSGTCPYPVYESDRWAKFAAHPLCA